MIKSRWMRWAAHENARVVRNTCSILIGKCKAKGSLGRPRRRWKDIVNIDLKEIGWENVGRLHLAEGEVLWQALIFTVMDLAVS
jgi:hypothetical protein